MAGLVGPSRTQQRRAERAAPGTRLSQTRNRPARDASRRAGTGIDAYWLF